MSIALTAEHQELARVAGSFLATHDARNEARALLEAPVEGMPSFWKEMAELGWMGLHINEAHGGQGFGLEELAIVVEELGFAMAPGPFLPTTLVAALLHEVGSDEVRRDLLPALSDGSVVGAVGLSGNLVHSTDGTLQGSAGLVLGAEVAKIFLVCVGNDVALLRADQAGVGVSTQKNIDPSRRVCAIDCDAVEVSAKNLFPGARKTLERLARTLVAAEAAGGARACTEMATEYAKERQQFGRPIGTFGPVKHHCANMLVATEQATAGAWGAARTDLDPAQADLAAAVAQSLALPAFAFCAKLNIQVHGGIGYTWEHDAHLYLRRATALEALFGPVDRTREDVVRLLGEGVVTKKTIALPAEAEDYRASVREFVDVYRGLPEDEKRKAVSDSGYLVPHWPRPWGRDAGPIEQLVIEQEFKGVRRPDLSISGWNTLTIAQNGNPEQLKRFVRPSLEGEIEFCQLFSEPGAGSDAAAVQTRGVKVDGGWRVSGQKVWTSGAQFCNRGFATVRTNADASKHQGISMMVVDMHAEGVEVRPLRQITGHSHFNEVFFDQVFVPDADVVGAVDQGWAVARNTLGNERVSIGGGSEGGMPGGPNLIALLKKYAPEDLGAAREVGAALAQTESIALLNLRGVIRAVEGSEPGAEANVTKLLGSDVAQLKGALAARIVGTSAAVREGEERSIATWLLATMGASIGGGTSEIVRNQIAERLLGLPRDPLIK
ncbi:MAG: alkylation response protein AidB-like acyl-CoA dehydrogenase [Hyphomicrobiaceae bacterium]|jgi:alkylation response protein AidB-like acyl-CoA dehydrogenase